MHDPSSGRVQRWHGQCPISLTSLMPSSPLMSVILCTARTTSEPSQKKGRACRFSCNGCVSCVVEKVVTDVDTGQYILTLLGSMPVVVHVWAHTGSYSTPVNTWDGDARLCRVQGCLQPHNRGCWLDCATHPCNRTSQTQLIVCNEDGLSRNSCIRKAVVHGIIANYVHKQTKKMKC